MEAGRPEHPPHDDAVERVSQVGRPGPEVRSPELTARAVDLYERLEAMEDGKIDAIAGELSSLVAEVRDLRRRVGEMAAALRSVGTFVGHDHWDPEGTRGLACLACGAYREWRRSHEKTIDMARGLAGEK